MSTQGEPLKGGKVYSGSRVSEMSVHHAWEGVVEQGSSHHSGQEAEREEGTGDQIQPSVLYPGGVFLPARTTPKVSCSS